MLNRCPPRARRSARGFARLLPVVALVGLAPGAQAVGGSARAVTGVLGDVVALAPPEQARPVILFFMSPNAKEESVSFGREVDERTLDADVESVAIVDLHRYGRWLRSLVLSRLRRSAEEVRAHNRTRRQARGLDSSDGAVNRWHLVGDFDGSMFSRFRVAPDPQHPCALVLDTRGALHGPYRDVAAVVAAVGEAAHMAHHP
jgi:hypothetical protein